MAKLLIIEDEPRMVVGLRDNFEYEGYEVITAETGSEGIKRALHDSPDLILLDVMFPKITCVELKTERPFLPVIVLTGRHHPSDEEKGNELGADDYVSRPFSIRELSARVKALLRRVRSIPRKSDISDPPGDLVESDTLEDDSGAAEKARISTVRSVKNSSRNRGEALSLNRPKQKLLAQQLQATRPSDFERPSSADSTFAIGRQLGHYRILTRIDAGGMGVVYMALDERLHRRVALKRLNARRLTYKLARVQLLEEARNASSLNHPNICTIYDIGEVDDEIYMVMELIDGQPLSRLIAERSLPTGDIISYGIQIADALEHAHSHGIVHRDLKSSNVVVRADGVAKVVDFGLSRRFEHQPPAITLSLGLHNSLGIIVGTIQYLAPEVLRGNIADERSDVWSFGVVLYELAAAALPFGGETAFSVGAAILQQSPAPLSGRVPLGLRTVIEGCLSKNVIERYQGFAEIASELRAIRALSSTVLPLGALQLAELRLRKSTHRILRQ